MVERRRSQSNAHKYPRYTLYTKGWLNAPQQHFVRHVCAVLSARACANTGGGLWRFGGGVAFWNTGCTCAQTAAGRDKSSDVAAVAAVAAVADAAATQSATDCGASAPLWGTGSQTFDALSKAIRMHALDTRVYTTHSQHIAQYPRAGDVDVRVCVR